ncbi:hypothetical protein [Mycolicibacterium pyrenivorans]|uniref:hypothetical protein n=1 Tax=Mycolicibacterium pyrenivorans TaxID=187102 RepID=UPI0021F2B502|nr:hypothetical protein [Mycolicibacterium pyrenivorans]
MANPARVASLTLLDPMFTFARIPLRTLAVSAVMAIPVAPQRVRRWFLGWVSGVPTSTTPCRRHG